jgi:hypothetical protein
MKAHRALRFAGIADMGAQVHKLSRELSWSKVFTKRLLGTSFALSVALVFGSLAIPVRVETPTDMKEIGFGLPFAFVVQDQRRYDPPLESFPRNFKFASPWEVPFRVQTPRMLASLLAVFLAIVLIAAIRKRYMR